MYEDLRGPPLLYLAGGASATHEEMVLPNKHTIRSCIFGGSLVEYVRFLDASQRRIILVPDSAELD